MAARVQVATVGPDCTLEDFQGRTVRLSDYRRDEHAVLVFNRGFK